MKIHDSRRDQIVPAIEKIVMKYIKEHANEMKQYVKHNLIKN